MGEELKPSRFGKQSEWWNSLTDAHRRSISNGARAYALEEAFNAGWAMRDAGLTEPGYA